MNTCHLCFSANPEAVCSKPRCKNRYCFKCIRQHFNKNYTELSYKKDCWICYACGNSCHCIRCKGIDSIRQIIKKSDKSKKIKKDKRSEVLSLDTEQKDDEEKDDKLDISQKGQSNKMQPAPTFQQPQLSQINLNIQQITQNPFQKQNQRSVDRMMVRKMCMKAIYGSSADYQNYRKFLNFTLTNKDQ